jgi:hypothetical protein
MRVGDRWLRWTNVAPVEPAVRVPAATAGTAFFPGGHGLWSPPNDINEQSDSALQRPVMVVAHNFGDITYHCECAARGEDVSALNGTWPRLRKLLRGAEPMCYFTNIYIGLLPPESRSLRGPFPGCHDARFVAECQRMMVEQLLVVKPRLLVALGMDAIPFLARTIPALSGWIGRKGGYKSLTQIDQEGGALVSNVGIPYSDLRMQAAAFYHPCEGRNQPHRRFEGKSGEAAELALFDKVIHAV